MEEPTLHLHEAEFSLHLRPWHFRFPPPVPALLLCAGPSGEFRDK